MGSPSELEQSIKKCQLMGQMGIQVQFILLASVIISMTIKKQFDKVQRTWWIWFLDCQKQGWANMYVHGLNILISIQFVTLQKQSADSDQCTWYLITYLSDILIGTFISYLLVKQIDKYFKSKGYHHLASGNYYYIKTVYKTILIAPGQSQPISCHEQIIINYYLFLQQFVIWLGVLTAGKTFLLLFQYYLSKYLQIYVEVLLSLTDNSPTFRLLTTFMFIPIILNAFQMWIQDNFLKKKGNMDDQEILEEAVAQEFLQETDCQKQVYIFQTSEHHSSYG